MTPSAVPLIEIAAPEGMFIAVNALIAAAQFIVNDGGGGGGAVTVIAALADLVVSAALVAVTVKAPGVVPAVNNPAGEMVPPVAISVKAVFVALPTVTVNCCVAPSTRLLLVGAIVIVTGGGGGGGPIAAG